MSGLGRGLLAHRGKHHSARKGSTIGTRFSRKEWAKQATQARHPGRDPPRMIPLAAPGAQTNEHPAPTTPFRHPSLPNP